MVNLMYKEIEDKGTAAKVLSHQNPVVFPETFVKFEPADCLLPREYAKYYDSILDMEVRNDDVWVVSLPKAGTTWTQEMTWLLANDLDYERAKTLLTLRFPYLEFDGAWRIKSVSDRLKEEDTPSSIDFVQNWTERRFIKTHLPLNMLPKEIQNNTKRPKIIYVARNPKDSCVSFYHHKVLLEGYLGTLEDFAEEYISELCLCAPYWTHVKEFWQRRHEPNVHFITYEAMKKDFPSIVKSTAEFLGKSLSDTEFEKLLKHLSFESMKNNPSVNYDEITEYLTELHGKERRTHFIRKGKVGSWKEELSAEAIAKFDKWIAKNKIEGIWEDI